MDHDDAKYTQQPLKWPPKVRQACNCCHARKIRCDGQDPCNNSSDDASMHISCYTQEEGSKGKENLQGWFERREASENFKGGTGEDGVHIAPRGADHFESQKQFESPQSSSQDDFGFQASPLITDTIITNCVDAFFTHKYPIMPILEARPRFGEQRTTKYPKITWTICSHDISKC